MKRWFASFAKNGAIDLNRKNVKAKLIRIGRMKGYRKEHFSLHKILIYGK